MMYLILKRFFDFIAALFGLLILSPLILIISILILLDSPGGVFFKQERIGRKGKSFFLLKFRTMISGADKKGLLSKGSSDKRITKAGKTLRRYKLDEIPQFWNILMNEMSIVGPRPEVRKYVEMYTEEQKRVLEVRPGLTDYASLQYINEEEILARYENPEKIYIKEIMPAKLSLNHKYIRERSCFTDLKIIVRTIWGIIGN